MIKYLDFIFLILFCFGTICISVAQRPSAIPYAHAHNDYEKIFRKDFKDAVKNGCISIEIDVFPYKNRLVVSHIPLFLNFKNDFEKRYLKPLKKYLSENENQIFQERGQRLILMVDLKRDVTKGYQLLREFGEKYQDMFAVWFPQKDSIKNGSVELLISGAKPFRELAADRIWYMRIDGNFGDVGSKNHNSLMVPRVSAPYASFFKWNGMGKVPEKELKRLRDFVKLAHSDSRTVRFWAMPNQIKVWKLMREEGVDWLNIDNLKLLKKFVKIYD
jgi:hypothetical protein